ncbi:MAG: UPF0182 family protein [Chitinivibrionales bacterium]|nr:UPF0182 family protein [Chitinivibrionales bacterium]
MTGQFKNQKMFWWILIAIVFFLIQFAGKGVTLITDFLWFKELRLSTIFLTIFSTKLVSGIVVGLIAWVVIYANILIGQRLSSRSQQFKGFSDIKLIELFERIPVLMTAVFILAVSAVAFFIGTWAANYWQTYLSYVHATPFNSNDPLFGKDISFYVFKLPFYQFAFQCFMIIMVLSFACSVLLYGANQNFVFNGSSILIAKKARAHLLVLLGIIVCSLFFVFHFLMYSTVTAQSSIVNGAGFAQVKVSIPIFSIMRFVCIIAGIMVWLSIPSKNFKLLVAAIMVVVAGAALAGIARQTVQKLIVGPDELNKEAPYIGWSIANTRNAFGIDKIESRHFVPDSTLTAASLQDNNLTISNIRLWDQAPLLKTYSQLQEIRTYYDFLDVDNDRYMINGQYRQVMLSPRELLPGSLPSRIWINEHLTYTHGYGLCMGPVTSVTAEGLPDFFVKNIPPISTISTSVSRPQIYYGEADAGYAIIKTGAKEFDYPSGNDNVYTEYSGAGGIAMKTLLHKLLFALRFQELKILLRSDISTNSRILFERQILKRIQKALPFLRYDNDPYMVITEDGKLVWMIDGYTISNNYPYSDHVKGLGNYIRNSVKAVIDAYDGTLAVYIADNADPLITTYSKVFPGVFKSMSDMPADLRNHIRYPQTLFTIQARIYSLYHMTDPQVFYNKEDVWLIPNSYTDAQEGPMSPYYTIMKLAEVGKKEEFILMVPFCPSKKENMIAWMAARCDQPNYGSLLVFDFPKQKLVYGPSQIESRINQDPEISKQLTLWNQGGSRVIRGSLLVIPVEQSLIYVQPLYLTSQSGGVPELKRIIVAYENQIAMESTLDKSLMIIFGGVPQPTEQPVIASKQEAPTPGTDGSIKQLISEANRQFLTAQQELKQGNWAGYGEAMKNVQKLLEELVKNQ